jgi:lysozyme
MAKTVNRVAVGSAGGVAAAIVFITPFIQQQEGYASIPYKDIGGVLSVCNGHTGSDIVVKEYSTAECKALTDTDIKKAADAVLKVTPDLWKRPYVLGATISFTYNLGGRTYAKSSVARDFNAGQYKLGCTDMLKYTFIGKTYSKGLANRRDKEYALCMKGAI